MPLRQNGVSLYELLIVFTLIGVMATLSLPSFFSLYKDQHNLALKTQLIHALLFAKKEANMLHETLAFCIGHNRRCFDAPNNTGLIFRDTFQDGILHHKSQLVASIMLPAYEGELRFRTFPKYRRSLLFHIKTWIESDNGTFWFCSKKTTKPLWGITINRFAMLHVLSLNAEGKLIDSSGNPLMC